MVMVDEPPLRVITTFLGVGIMSLAAPLPMDRLYLVNPGQTIEVGDRTLTAVKPPVFDNPVTTGFYDDRSGALFSADCFGAMLAAVPQNAADLSHDELRKGQVFWATVDSPWLHKVDRGLLAKELDAIRTMDPTMILSSHLPAAGRAMTERLIASLEAVPSAEPFVGPDQEALEQMLSGMTTTVTASAVKCTRTLTVGSGRMTSRGLIRSKTSARHCVYHRNSSEPSCYRYFRPAGFLVRGEWLEAFHRRCEAL